MQMINIRFGTDKSDVFSIWIKKVSIMKGTIKWFDYIINLKFG